MRQDQDVNIYSLVQSLVRYKKPVLALTLGTTLAAALFAFTLPSTYRAEANLLPVQSLTGGEGGVGGMLEKMGGLGGLLGALSDSGRNTSSKILQAVLQSRSLADKVLEREKLIPVLIGSDPELSKEPERARQTARDMLMKNIKVVEDRKLTTIRIQGTFTSPELSQKVVAAYLEELRTFLNKNQLTLAQRNLNFIDGRLHNAKKELLSSGKELANFYDKYRVSSTSGRVSVNIEQNAENMPEGQTPNSFTIEVPQKVYFEFLQSQNMVLKQITTLLSSQAEVAKIEEAKERITFQILDRPELPMGAHGPKRWLITALGFFMGLLLSILGVASYEKFRMNRGPRLAERAPRAEAV